MYPNSRPVFKFLAWENGVVGGGGAKLDWELREGIAKTGKGEPSVTVRARERRLGRIIGFRVEFCKLDFGFWRQWEVVGIEWLEVGGRRWWPIKLKLMLVMAYPQPFTAVRSFWFHLIKRSVLVSKTMPFYIMQTTTACPKCVVSLCFSNDSTKQPKQPKILFDNIICRIIAEVNLYWMSG